MESLFKLGILMQIVDMVSGPVGKISATLDALQTKASRLQPVFDKFKDYGRWIAGAGVVGALGLGIAVTQFANLEEAQLNLRTLVMDSAGRVGPEYEKLNSLAEQLGTSLPGSTQDMIQMFIALREQGVQTNVILGGMGEAAAKFAVLMKVPFAEAATYVAKFSEALGIADKEAVSFMDILQRTKAAAGLAVTDLAESFKYVGPSLKALRVQGLEAGRDVAASLGLMAAAGIEGSQAGTNFAQALAKMAETTSRLKSGEIAKLVGPLLSAKGIRLNFFDGSGNFVGIRNMIGEMEKLRALNPQDQLFVLGKLFGDEAARPLSVFINQGVAGFDAMTLKMKNQADMQTKIAEIMKGTKMQWETLTGTLSTVVAHVGAVVTKSAGLTAVMRVANNLAGRLDSWIVANPTTAGIIGGVAVALTTAALAAGGLMLAIGLGGTLFLKMTVGAGQLKLAIGLLQMSFTSLISRMQVLTAASSWAWIRTAITGFRTWAIAINAGTLPALLNLTKALWGVAVAVVSNPLFWIPAAIALVVAGLVWLYNNSINVKAAFQSMAYAIGFALAFIAKGWSAIFGFLQFGMDVIGQAYDAIVNALPTIGSAFLQALGSIINVMPALLGNLFTSGQKIVTTLVSGIKSMANGPVEAIKEIFSKVRNLLPFSDAKEGPLSQLTLSGSRIMSTLGEGVNSGAAGLQRTMAGALAGAALTTSIAVAPPPASAQGGVVNQATLGRSAAAEVKQEGKKLVIQNLTVNMHNASNARSFIDELQTLVEAHDGE